MPRLSVYVPDQLLERARSLDERADNLSKLVQRGLTRLVEEETSLGDPPYAVRPDGTSQRVAAVAEQMTATARAEYEAGYLATLDVASDLPLKVIESMADCDFVVRRWIELSRDEAEFERAGGVQESLSWTETLEPVLGLALHGLADRDEFTLHPSRARVRGFADAIRDIWIATERPDETEAFEVDEPDSKAEGDTK